jgi:HNH endonuclease
VCDSALHDEIEQLNFSATYIYSILHAMVCLGTLTILECQYPNCHEDSRTFDSTLGLWNPRAVSIDHIHPRHAGGSHRMENLRAIHRVCNWRWGGNISSTSNHTDEGRARMAAHTKARHAEGWQQTRDVSTINKIQETKNKRSLYIKTMCDTCGRSYDHVWMIRHRNEGRCHNIV